MTTVPALMGKKVGMTLLFDEEGRTVVCTVIEVEPNVVTQIKKKNCDGYNAVQIGAETVRGSDPRTVERRAKKPLSGHFKKAGVTPRYHLAETRLEDVEDYKLGQELTVALYAEVSFIDVTAVSKGKGFQGGIKLHGFAGGPAAHGSKFHRLLGSTGMRSTPGRSLPGGKRPSHMGAKRVTVQNLRIFRVLEEDNAIVVRGAVPGPRGGKVLLSPAKKRSVSRGCA